MIRRLRAAWASFRDPDAEKRAEMYEARAAEYWESLGESAGALWEVIDATTLYTAHAAARKGLGVDE